MMNVTSTLLKPLIPKCLCFLLAVAVVCDTAASCSPGQPLSASYRLYPPFLEEAPNRNSQGTASGSKGKGPTPNTGSTELRGPFHHFMVNMTKHCCQFEPDVKIHKKFLNAYDMEINHGEETFAVPWTKSSAELCESPTDGSVFLPLIESVGKSRPPLQTYYRNRS